MVKGRIARRTKGARKGKWSRVLERGEEKRERRNRRWGGKEE